MVTNPRVKLSRPGSRGHITGNTATMIILSIYQLRLIEMRGVNVMSNGCVCKCVQSCTAERLKWASPQVFQVTLTTHLQRAEWQLMTQQGHRTMFHLTWTRNEREKINWSSRVQSESEAPFIYTHVCLIKEGFIPSKRRAAGNKNSLRVKILSLCQIHIHAHESCWLNFVKFHQLLYFVSCTWPLLLTCL